MHFCIKKGETFYNELKWSHWLSHCICISIVDWFVMISSSFLLFWLLNTSSYLQPENRKIQDYRLCFSPMQMQINTHAKHILSPIQMSHYKKISRFNSRVLTGYLGRLSVFQYSLYKNYGIRVHKTYLNSNFSKTDGCRIPNSPMRVCLPFNLSWLKLD